MQAWACGPFLPVSPVSDSLYLSNLRCRPGSVGNLKYCSSQMCTKSNRNEAKKSCPIWPSISCPTSSNLLAAYRSLFMLVDSFVIRLSWAYLVKGLYVSPFCFSLHLLHFCHLQKLRCCFASLTIPLLSFTFDEGARIVPVLLEQQCPIEHSALIEMLMFLFVPSNMGVTSHMWLLEQLKCSWCIWRTKYLVLFHFN